MVAFSYSPSRSSACRSSSSEWPTNPGASSNLANTVAPRILKALRTTPSSSETRIKITPFPNRALALPAPT
jgi:hypothetical protein